MEPQHSPSQPDARADFGRTRWSIVAALREGDEAQARDSLSQLCQRYWGPVYAYVRRCGHPPEGAATLVQAFLSHLVTRLRSNAVETSGGFRTFLQHRLEAFLASDWTRLEESEPRPELRPPWSLEVIERRQGLDHAAPMTPAQAFQRAFAMELLAHALEQLREEAGRSGRVSLFNAVRPYLGREPGPGEYQRLATEMGSSPLAAVIATKRLRQRFQELIDAELLQIVEDAKTLEAERLALLESAGLTR